ncbi:MAG: hypothetical protein OXC57_07670 [Rhodobacteraceae bacterium]|nr:hypothetical protein [Paracoccaceae bacterium]
MPRAASWRSSSGSACILTRCLAVPGDGRLVGGVSTGRFKRVQSARP